MPNFLKLNKDELLKIKSDLKQQYENIKKLGLNLDMSRGKPSPEQLDLSTSMLNAVNSSSNYFSKGNIDCRNYGVLDGIDEMKELMSQIMEVDKNNIIIGGNSSLSLMFDTISHFMTHGTSKDPAWIKQKDIKFLCPCPGYDRHFSITEYFGIKMIPIKMNSDGPDMDEIQKLVENDSTIKGIWCVPKYSNPQGITYSDEVVTRFAKLKPAANDFRIFWDNAYAVHGLTNHEEKLLNIFEKCEKYNSCNLPIMFCSTSKITFAGAGISAIACQGENLENLKKRFSFKIIGYDKLNQLRHYRFLKNINILKYHMKKHAQILNPKFSLVINKFNDNFSNNPILSWTNPKGGYFISVETINGCAKETVRYCKEAGLKLTSAGSTYPYGIDPNDSNIRIAPSYPNIKELGMAMDVFCLCVKLAAAEKLIKDKT